MRPPYRFVLEAIDPSTECVAFDASFEAPDLNELCRQLDMAQDQLEKCASYPLERSELDQLIKAFGVSFDPGDFPSSIRPWLEIDALPYKVHTNRELALMLAGTKPLAVFVEAQPPRPARSINPEAMFEPHVSAGRVVKREHIYRQPDPNGRQRDFRRLLYAQPDQQWRIDAYLLLLKTAQRSGWNEGFERMEGSLLGYEDWQNDAFIELMWRSGPKRGSGI